MVTKKCAGFVVVLALLTGVVHAQPAEETEARATFEIRNPHPFPLIVLLQIGETQQRIELRAYERTHQNIAFFSGERAVIAMVADEINGRLEVKQPAYVYSIGYWVPQSNWYLTFPHRGTAYGPKDAVRNQLSDELKTGFDKAGEGEESEDATATARPKVKIRNRTDIGEVRFIGVHYSGVQFTRDLAADGSTSITKIKNGDISLTAFRASDQKILDTFSYPVSDSMGFAAILIKDDNDPHQPYKLVGEPFVIP